MPSHSLTDPGSPMFSLSSGPSTSLPLTNPSSSSTSSPDDKQREAMRQLMDGFDASAQFESELSSLSDEADVGNKGKKRARESEGAKGKPKGKEGKKKRKIEGTEVTAVDGGGEVVEKEKGAYCHQCRQRCDLPDGTTPRNKGSYLRCTVAKEPFKNGRQRLCGLTYCQSCLSRHYGQHVQKELAAGKATVREGHGTVEGHEVRRVDGEGEYVWECWSCKGECKCSNCRKKHGLEPLGQTSQRKQPDSSDPFAGPTPSKQQSRPSNGGSTLKTPIDLAISDDSELSDLSDSDDPVLLSPTTEQKKAKPRKSTATNGSAQKAKKPKVNGAKVEGKKGGKEGGKAKVAKKGEAKGDVTPGKKEKQASTPGKKAKQASTPGKKDGKSKVGEKGKSQAGEKGKATDKTEKEKKPRPKPIKKPDPPVEPPLFEKVDTKLGRDEAEQRIMLREYISRFRAVLGVPERNLAALDDFDRPLSEASVRLFAGGMLELVRDELELVGGVDDLVETIAHHREELRYYADLARFANIYNSLSEPLSLRMPREAPKTPKRPASANAETMRAILDLAPDEEIPAWALEDDSTRSGGPSRRTGASRIPQPVEVVRMLLAFAERTLSTPRLRAELENTAGEAEERRKNASEVKRENTRWEAARKKLMEERVRCKSAAETKKNREALSEEQKEHDLRLAHLAVNLRAMSAKRALRHDIVGTDLDGRVYYLLTPKAVEDDTRPPLGWASGLLVWGRGVPRSKTEGSKDTAEDDELPVNAKRWTHFGKSEAVKQLAKWLEWRCKQEMEQLRPKKVKATPAKGKGTPAKSGATPSKTKTTTPGGSGRKVKMEVVIPLSAKKSITSSTSSSLSSASKAKKEEEDDESELSTPPVSPTEELMETTKPPEGWRPSADMVEEGQVELIRRVREVAEWLEVLEWKGMGEVV